MPLGVSNLGRQEQKEQHHPGAWAALEPAEGTL